MNSRIPTETEIATEHRVGRSTVREATRSVALLGMLESLPGCGTFVRSASPVNSVLAGYLGQQPAAEVLVLRSALEAEAAALAALRRSDAQLAAIESAAGVGDPCHRLSEFHRAVFEAARTPLLTELYGSLLAIPRQARAAAGLRSNTERAAEHQRIARAIRAGDPVKARAAAARHGERELLPAGDRGTDAPLTLHALGRRMAPAG